MSTSASTGNTPIEATPAPIEVKPIEITSASAALGPLSNEALHSMLSSRLESTLSLRLDKFESTLLGRLTDLEARIQALTKIQQPPRPGVLALVSDLSRVDRHRLIGALLYDIDGADDFRSAAIAVAKELGVGLPPIRHSDDMFSIHVSEVLDEICKHGITINQLEVALIRAKVPRWRWSFLNE
jgi:hypothetical protein